MNFRPFGIRARMIALIAAAIAPFAALIAAGVVYSYGQADRNARQTVAYDARLGAMKFSRIFLDAKVMLGTVRIMPPLQAQDRSRCDGFLQKTLTNTPIFVSMGVFDAAGMLVCHSSVSDSRPFADRGLVEAVARSRAGELVVGAFMIGPITRKPTVAVAMKLDETGFGQGLSVFGSLNLDAFESLARDIAGDTDHTVALLDATSQRVLVRWPHIVAFGTQFPDNPLFAAVNASPAGGTMFGVGFDKVHRFFGYAPLTDAKGRDLSVLLGIPEQEAFGSIRARASWALGLSVIAFLGAVLLAAGIAFWTQLQPILRLMSFSETIGQGDFSRNVTMEGWQAVEFHRFAQTLNTTALKLAAAQVAEQKIVESERRFRLIADNTGDMISVIDNDHRRIFVSGASKEIVGYEPHELMGSHPIGLVVEKDVSRISALLHRMGETHKVQDEQYRVRRSDGAIIWVEVSGRKIDDGSGYVFTMRDIGKRKAMETALEEANARLSALAVTDELTQLNNRRAFNRLLDQETKRSRRDGTPLSLLLIDVDRFKLFNDRYGHPAGDECLRRVAAVISDSLAHPGSSCARYGGEEFAVILPNMSREAARLQADAIRLAVRALQMPHAGSEMSVVTISIGLAGHDRQDDARSDDRAIDRDEDHVDARGVALLRQADEALYQAKANGRDRVVAAQASPEQAPHEQAPLQQVLAAPRKRAVFAKR